MKRKAPKVLSNLKGEGGGTDRPLITTLHLRDPRGVHCRVAALIAYTLRVEAPHSTVTLRTPEGREASGRSPLQLTALGARHSRIVEVEAEGLDAAKAIEALRGILEREPLTREEVIEAIPPDVSGEIGEIRSNQQWAIGAPLRRQDREEVETWKSPGGWLYELIGFEHFGYEDELHEE